MEFIVIHNGEFLCGDRLTIENRLFVLYEHGAELIAFSGGYTCVCYTLCGIPTLEFTLMG